MTWDSFDLGTSSRSPVIASYATNLLHFWENRRPSSRTWRKYYLALKVLPLYAPLSSQGRAIIKDEEIPGAFRVLKNKPHHIIRQERHSVQPLPKALEVFEALHIALNNIYICVEALFPAANGVTNLKLRLMRRTKPYHPLNAPSYSRKTPLKCVETILCSTHHVDYKTPSVSKHKCHTAKGIEIR